MPTQNRFQHAPEDYNLETQFSHAAISNTHIYLSPCTVGILLEEAASICSFTLQRLMEKLSQAVHKAGLV